MYSADVEARAAAIDVAETDVIMPTALEMAVVSAITLIGEFKVEAVEVSPVPSELD